MRYFDQVYQVIPGFSVYRALRAGFILPVRTMQWKLLIWSYPRWVVNLEETGKVSSFSSGDMIRFVNR